MADRPPRSKLAGQGGGTALIRILRNIALALLGFLAVGRMIADRSRKRATESVGGGPLDAVGRSKWKRRLLRGAALGAAVAVAGFLVAASGIIPLRASSGHWGITAWFLNFSMKRSVITHTIGLSAPPLDDPKLVLRGASHFETGCRPCHGAVNLQLPGITRQMTPRPPYLPPTIPRWKPDELFYIVKHGVKFTGMPAWPAQQRDDEVWAVVAFLLLLPGLDDEGYRRLAFGPVVDSVPLSVQDQDVPLGDLLVPQAMPAIVTESCGRCHGLEGLGRGPGAFPRLAGQRYEYLVAALGAFNQGTRHSGIMQPVAESLSPQDMRVLAQYYARLGGNTPPPARVRDPESIARGREIALRGIPNRLVPSCNDCHGPAPPAGGFGVTVEVNPTYPILGGQYADYMVQQLKLFKSEKRGGSVYAHLMRPVVSRMSEEQMWDVARYYEALRSNGESEPNPETD